LLREGIASLLHNTSYKVVMAAATANEFEHVQFPTDRPMVALLGIDEKEHYSTAADSIRMLRSAFPKAKIVIVAETNEPLDLKNVAVLAADACIVNIGSRDTLLKALELTLLDQQAFVFGRQSLKTQKESVEANSTRAVDYRETGGQPANGMAAIPLSERERQILVCLAGGQSNKMIARQCQISEATVKVHIKTILRKTQARNRTQAAIWAIERGLRDPAFAQNFSATSDVLPKQSGKIEITAATAAPSNTQTRSS
jgi:two-component system nitrate/nitrite response regulator NarL